MTGCGAAKTIVAVYTDPKAAILKDAGFGIIGDFQKVIPALLAKVKILQAEGRYGA